MVLLGSFMVALSFGSLASNLDTRTHASKLLVIVSVRQFFPERNGCQFFLFTRGKEPLGTPMQLADNL